MPPLNLPLRRCLPLLCATVMSLGAAAPALGWGRGHQDIARQVFARLPPALLDQLPPPAREAAIKTYALWPDSFAAFGVDDVGEDAIAQLNRAGIANRYALHTDKGRAMSFVLLVQALREHRYARAALWIGVLSHSTSDMAAINHDPLVHSVIYTSGYHLRLADGQRPSALGVFDISDLVAVPGADASVWPDAAAAVTLADDGRDPATALLDIMRYGQQGADFCATRGIPILADAVRGAEQHDDGARRRARQALAELGAWAVARTVRDATVAARLAAGTDAVELTPAVEAAFAAWDDRFMRERSLSDDALFAPILRPLPPGNRPATAPAPPLTGVVLEPTWRMNDAFLGYGDRILAASVCRSLAAVGRPYATLDVRDVLAHGFPPPERLPAVVLSATALRNYGWMHVADLDRAVTAYLNAGGHLVWIGGEARPVDGLTAVGHAMGRTPKQALPAQELLHGDAALHDARLVLVDPPNAWNFERPPALNVGWTQPLCPWRFEHLGPDLEPALRLQGPQLDMTVGVYWRASTHGPLQGAYLPIYSLAPHLFVPSDRWPEPAMPQLDAPPLRILTAVLDRLLARQP
jgi:hypothetical protein